MNIIDLQQMNEIKLINITAFLSNILFLFYIASESKE